MIRSEGFVNSKFQKFLPGVLLLILLGFEALHQLFVGRAHPDAVYMDTLRLVSQLQDWREGAMSLFDFWQQGSSHRGLINQAFLFANVKLFSLDVMLANRMTGVAILAVVSIIVLAFLRTTSRAPATLHRSFVRCAVTVLITAQCFSWAGVEVLTLDLGLPLWVKNFAFVGYFLAHATLLSDQGRTSWGRTIALSVYGALTVLLLGMGWSYAFVGAVIGVHFLLFASDIAGLGGRSSPVKLVPAAVLLASLAAYIFAGVAGDDGAASALVRSLPRTLNLSVYALGSPWIGVEAMHARQWPLSISYVAGLISILAAVWVVWRRLRCGFAKGSLFPLYLIGYGVLTAVSVSAARGQDGANGVIASRYYMDLMLFSVGTIWAWGEDIASSNGRWFRGNAAAFFLFCAIVGLGQAIAYRTEWNIAPYRAAIFPLMNVAIARGVPDEAAARLLQSPLAHARAGAQVLREQRLASFAGSKSEVCSSKAIGYDLGWYEKEPGGIWMTGEARISLPACACSLISSVYLPPDFSGRVMSVEDAATHVQIKQVALTPGATTEIELPASARRRAFVIRSSFVTIPSESGSKDLRHLAAFWGGAAYVCR
jgi:hypothetical protein